MQKILLVGNPNTGKTTLFNSLTKSNEHVGNWHGVTIDSKNKIFKTPNNVFNLVDLPGIYSLTPLSLEEKVSTDYIFNNPTEIIMNIVDINNIEHNLFLTNDLLDFGANIFLVINKTSKKPNKKIDVNLLSQKLRVPVFYVDATNKKEIEKLKENIENFAKKVKKSSKNENLILKTEIINQIGQNNFNEILNQIVKELTNTNSKNAQKTSNNAKKIENNEIFNKNNHFGIDKNFLIKKLLENDENISNFFNFSQNLLNFVKNLKEKLNLKDFLSISITKTYSKIKEILLVSSKKENSKKINEMLDKILLNKFFCLPIFFAILFGIFYLTFFSVGKYLSNFLTFLTEDILGNHIFSFIAKHTNSAVILSFFNTAIIKGFSTLLSFMPQVCLLFLFLGVLEDSGYLSRLAFLFDDIFSKFGLSGKAIYTLLMGFGCGTTATLTARNMENKNSKIKTAILTPYMSCSAKLPIYMVIGGTFFGAKNILVIFGLYLLGAVVAILMSVLLDKFALKSKNQSFILEFPTYRFPSAKRLAKIVWDNLKQFIIRIAGVLFSVNIIVWLLSSFNFKFQFVEDFGGQSMLETFGKFFSVIFVPLGFGTWGATSALVSGLVAKEVIISSIAMFNHVKEGENQSLEKSLIDPTSAVFFTPASALSYLVFCLLYMPCLSNMIMLKKEIGTKWLIISMCLQFCVAYVLSFVVYNAYKFYLLFHMWALVILALFVFCIFFAVFLCFKLNKKTYKFSCKNCSKLCSRCEQDHSASRCEAS